MRMGTFACERNRRDHRCNAWPAISSAHRKRTSQYKAQRHSAQRRYLVRHAQTMLHLGSLRSTAPPPSLPDCALFRKELLFKHSVTQA